MFVWTILGCCSGYYGKDCNHRCSINCNTYNCDRFTGQCFGGCKPGWTGFMCDQGKHVLMMFYVLLKRILIINAKVTNFLCIFFNIFDINEVKHYYSIISFKIYLKIKKKNNSDDSFKNVSVILL